MSMKLLFFSAVLIITTAGSPEYEHPDLKNTQQLLCDTVPYPATNMQPVEPNPVNGNGTPLNNPNNPTTIQTDTFPHPVDTIRKVY